jgi:pyruvate dehydrogenase E2 component (dihydrolipoamide acetyltransferase)
MASGIGIAATPVEVALAQAPPGGFSEWQLSRRRRAIGRRLAQAAAIPQFAVTRRISLAAARNAVQASRAEGTPATLTDAVILAVAAVAVEARIVNAWLLGDVVRVFDHASLALAVETEDGVVAPVLQEADTLQLAAIGALRQDLVERARSGRLHPDELSQATLTLTNVGPIGGDQIFPVVTPPQVGVVGVGRDMGKGAVFTFVGDHRALDGADGARFLARLDDVLQSNDAR